MNARDSVPKMNQQIDWSGIRAAAVVIGVREAARRSAINLTPEEQVRFTNRVLQRSKREGWVVQKKAALAQMPTEQQALPTSSSVINGSDSMLSALKEHGEHTKINLAKVAKNASEVLLKKKGNALLKQHQAFKNFVSGSGQLHDWGTSSQGGSINLNILTGQAAVQINSGKSDQE